MGWKDLAKLGRQWADAKKDELLTADRRTREGARSRADSAERGAQAEVGTSFLEAVLPDRLSQLVTDQRPENVAAREAARAAEQDRRRRADLAGRATAELRLSITGGEHGQATLSLPVERTEDDPGRSPDPDYPDEPPPVPWLKVVLEAADPVQVGSITVFVLSLAVPGYRGEPGRYDLAELYERGQSGEMESWDASDVFLSPDPDAGDTIWYWDSTGPAYVDVAEKSVSFDLPMQSAMSTIRAVGTITWP